MKEKGKKVTTTKSHIKFQIGRNIVLILREEDFLEFKVWEKGICYLRPNGNWIKVQICKGFEENLKLSKTSPVSKSNQGEKRNRKENNSKDSEIQKKSNLRDQ